MEIKVLKIGDLSAQVPIVQGGMGVGVSLSGLATAVANEGGIGVISTAGLGLLYRDLSPDFKTACVLGLKKELHTARQNSAHGIIGVNIMVAMTNFAEMAQTAIDEGVDIIFSGAGLPLDLPSYLTPGCKTKLVPIVSSARAVKVICEKWHNSYGYLPDAVVLEGPKAGGHLGYKLDQLEDTHFSLEELLPQVVAQVRVFEEMYDKKIPVIAAGGIFTGEDIYKVLELGASGVQMGTIFVATDECDANIAFKQSYVDAEQEDIVLIKSPVGMPGRAVFNKFIQLVTEGKKQPKACPFHCIKTCDISKSPYCIMLALYNAFKGDLSKGYAFAGANAFKTKKIRSVKETIKTLMAELMLEKGLHG